jgi:hypothetical protein
MRKVCADLAPPAPGAYVYLCGGGTLHGLLCDLASKLFEAGDPFLRQKMGADGDKQEAGRWLRKQTSLRLRGILFSALRKGRYWIILDHAPPFTHPVARLVKEFIWRCETPVYVLARGCEQEQIGYGWSLYWTDKLRIALGALPVSAARKLLGNCIEHFGLSAVDSHEFRETLLRFSGLLPGAIVKMCALAAETRYRFGRQVKMELVHVDYLLSRQSDRLPAVREKGHREQRDALSSVG